MRKVPEILGGILAVILIVVLMGFIAWLGDWDEGMDDYRIERSRPQAKFIKV